jgi:hypothetical protein
MKELVLTPQGAKALGAMVLSCGEIEDCDLMLGRLQGIAEAVPMRSLAERADGSWFNPFRGVYEFTVSHSPETTEVGAYEVAAFFGSQQHAEVKYRDPFSKLKMLVGDNLGFLLHVGMPLAEDLTYRNGKYKLKVTNLVDLGGEGVPFSHLGAFVRLPLYEEQVRSILKDQAGHEPFMKALAKYSDQTVKLPENYIEATERLAKRARD